MPIIANAVTISAQEVPTFKSSPLITSKRTAWLPNLFPTVIRNCNSLSVVVL
jgi:hypothetical protein